MGDLGSVTWGRGAGQGELGRGGGVVRTGPVSGCVIHSDGAAHPGR